MTGSATNFKLGVLAMLSITAVIISAVVLGMHSGRVPTVTYHTYFDETVQGLELGSPVKFRGVRIGNVDDIAIAPDGRYVDVTLSIQSTETARLDTDRTDLRAQLSTLGLTGVKYVDLDFFVGAAVSPLPFVPAPRTILSQPSMLKGLEASVESISQRLPALIDRTTDALARFDRLLEDVDRANIPERVAAAIDATTAVALRVRGVIGRLDKADLGGKASQTLARVDTAVTRLDAAVTAATHQVTGAASEASLGVQDTLDQISEAAQALRDVLDEIERDPDILVKGRGRSGAP